MQRPRTFLIRKDMNIAWLVQNYLNFCWIGGLGLLLELHLKGCALNSFSWFNVFSPIFLSIKDLTLYVSYISEFVSIHRNFDSREVALASYTNIVTNGRTLFFLVHRIYWSFSTEYVWQYFIYSVELMPVVRDKIGGHLGTLCQIYTALDCSVVYLNLVQCSAVQYSWI